MASTRCAGEIVHLFARLVRRFRHADKLRVESRRACVSGMNFAYSVPCPPSVGEKRAAEEKFRAEFFAGAEIARAASACHRARSPALRTAVTPQ